MTGRDPVILDSGINLYYIQVRYGLVQERLDRTYSGRASMEAIVQLIAALFTTFIQALIALFEGVAALAEIVLEFIFLLLLNGSPRAA